MREPARAGRFRSTPPPIGDGHIHAFEIYGAVMVVFFLISFPLTRLAAHLERRLI